MRSLAFLSLTALVAVSCTSSSSDSDDNTGGDDAGADAGMSYPADHPPLPQVITEGGKVMTAPKFVTITFPNDTLLTDIESFSSKISASQYWTAVVGEYGVGAGTSSVVHMPTAPASTQTDEQIQSFIDSQVGTTLPQPDANTLYVLYYPASTTITMQSGQACQDFGGYHSATQLSSGKVAAYAVIPRCPSPFPGVTVLDQLTASASHEYIEAATDPLNGAKLTYGNADAAGGGWALAGGGAEIGDMCAELGDVFIRPADVGYLVQRTWSDQAAAASHDPCVPQGASPYFNSAPNLPDSVNLDIGAGHQQAVSVVHIPVGQSQTIELDLFSDGDTGGPWKVSAIDFGSALMGGPPELGFAFDNASGQNGDKINLSITSLKKDPMGFAAFFIENQLGSGCTGDPTATTNCTTTFWVALVQQ